MRGSWKQQSARAASVGVALPGPAASHLRSLFERSTVGMALLDSEGAIAHANPALEYFLGHEGLALRGRHLADFAPPEDAEQLRTRWNVATADKGAATLEARFVRPDGTVVWGALTFSPAAVDEQVQYAAVLQDVTARKEIEARLVHQAYHDPLTSLANRKLFRERVEHALSWCGRDASRLAVILLDLDNFKTVNDTQGHGVGDRLLQVVARRLQNATRGCDTVARLGGDEFGILVEQVDVRDGAEAVAERIVGALRLPVSLDGDRALLTGGSLGIAIYTGSEGTEELLRNADVAMYEAKQNAPGRWVVFDPSMHTALIERVTLESDLRRALERCQLLERPRLANTSVFPAFESRKRTDNEFTVAYQPIIDLKTGVVSGVEALARWTHPERGAVAPEVFIPAAEGSGLISAIGRWILREACRQGAAWNATRADAPITVTVNLSAKQLASDGLASEVESVLHETGFPPANLLLEITETAIMHNAEATLERLHQLKRLGVGLAIDDFGTGYSSLSYLQRFPVDVVKIDRIFTERVRSTGDGAALIRTILALADLLGLKTIAEGVEDPVQRDALRDLGCDSAQGFLFGRPLGAAEVEAVLGVGAAVP